MTNIVCFGEIMMRLSPEGYFRFVQANKFDVSYSGGEANVAVSLANYGHDVFYVTKIPESEIGQCAVNALRRYGVATNKIVRGGERLGIYFAEKGAAQRGSKVVYDRAGSSIATAKKTDFDWDKIFENANWFHFTGITPALGGELPDICIEACKKAKEKNITVSCDLNYRKKLWTKEKANEVMSRIMPYVDVCIANEEDASNVFGISASGTSVTDGKLNHDGYIEVAQKLTQKFDFKYVAITLRTSISASDNKWAGLLYTDAHAYFSPEYMIHIVDRVGGGDAFGGALIHRLITAPSDIQGAVDFAAAASCLKHSIEQDFNLVSEQEVLSLMGGNASGRVQR